MSSPALRPIPLHRRLAFSALLLAVALLATEGAARLAAGVLDRDWRISPLPAHPSFQVVCPLGDLLQLCPEERLEYERVRPEVFFPTPDRPRVVVVGESFVYGLGLERDQAFPARLAAHLGDRAEVLNFGRCGTYASRLQPVVAEALDLAPTVLVLALGNNEHTMTSFYTGWAGRHPEQVYAVSALFGRFQAWGLLFRGLGGDSRVQQSVDRPDPVLTDDVDRQVWAGRRRPPDLAAFPDGVVGREATRILEREQRLKERIFRDELASMVDLAEQVDVPVVLCTLPHRLAEPPVLSGVHGGDEARIRAIVAEVRAGAGAALDPLVDEGLALDPHVAELLYHRGLREMVAGDRRAASATLWEATEWDMAPDITPSLNRIIREVAREGDATLADLAGLSEEWLDRPFDVLQDSVHLNPRGADEVGARLAEVVGPLLPPAGAPR